MYIYLHHPIKIAKNDNNLTEALYADDLDKLNELIEFLSRKGVNVTLTCDDGFKSVLGIVDLAITYNVKLIVFPIAGILSFKQEAIPYEVNLMKYIDQVSMVKFENSQYECNTLEEKKRAYYAIHSKLKRTSLKDKFNLVNSLYSLNPGMRSQSGFADYLNADDLNYLAGIKNVIIGSHGMYHCDHRTLGDLGKIKSLLLSKFIIQKVIGKPVEDFAAPYGSCTKKLLVLSKLCGYKTFYSTNFLPYHCSSAYSRITLDAAYTTIIGNGN